MLEEYSESNPFESRAGELPKKVRGKIRQKQSGLDNETKHGTFREIIPNDYLPMAYFDDQAVLHREFLHPGGRAASLRLIEFLPASLSSDTLLEIGCGLGKTAELVLENLDCQYMGVDGSAEMLERARNRVLPLYNSRATFIQHNLSGGILPVANESIAAVFAESVIVLLDPVKIFNECFRILKPGGILICNERLWGLNTSEEDRKKANEACVDLLGIVAAPLKPGDAKDWESAILSTGLVMIRKELITANRGEERHRRKSFLSMLGSPSAAVTLIKDRIIAARFKQTWLKMENWFFVAQKPG